MKKNIKLLFIILIIGITFISCSKTDVENNSFDNNSYIDDEKITEETTMIQYHETLPAMDFGGRSLRIISRESQQSHDVQQFTDFGNNEIDTDTINGSQINDVVYNRNRELEVRYNFVFDSYQPNLNPADFSKKSILADSDDYDIIIDALLPMTSLMGSMLFINLDSLEYIALEQDCWDYNANKNLSIGNKNFLAIGDLLILDKKGTWSTLFNKELARNYKLDDLYQIVHDGKWTIDIMHDMAKKTSLDLNGDSVMDETDQWGYLTESYNANVHMFGSNTNFTSKDSADYPIVSLYNDRSVAAFEKVLKIMTDSESTLNNSFSPNGAADTLKAFGEGRALFYMVGIGTAMEYRYMDADFGIIPIPKYDEEQSDYYTTLSIYNSACLGIPTTNNNPDEVGFLLQAICAASTNTLKETFYNIVLSGVTIRDLESLDMLDIIFNNRIFDLGFTYNWGGIGNIYTKLIASNSSDLTSAYAEIESKVITAITKVVDEFSN